MQNPTGQYFNIDRVLQTAIGIFGGVLHNILLCKSCGNQSDRKKVNSRFIQT